MFGLFGKRKQQNTARSTIVFDEAYCHSAGDTSGAKTYEITAGTNEIAFVFRDFEGFIATYIQNNPHLPEAALRSLQTKKGFFCAQAVQDGPYLCSNNVGHDGCIIFDPQSLRPLADNAGLREFTQGAIAFGILIPGTSAFHVLWATMYRTAPPAQAAASGAKIPLHGPEGFEGMRRVGRLTAGALDMIARYVRPGITTGQLHDIVMDFAAQRGAQSAILNFNGYPKGLSISRNHVVCHGIPGPEALLDGDIVTIDVSLVLDGWHANSSRTYAVGKISSKAARLVETAHRATMQGIAAARSGALTCSIGEAIQAAAGQEGCGVVRDYCSHGIGRALHCPPQILHYGQSAGGPRLKPGMFFTVQPMINLGKPHIKMLADGWTAVTRDRSLSAQFGHTVGVTETGCEIFTRSPAGMD
jgi:methionyl aminopeptidase